MKRFFFISLALVLVASFAVTAYAEDRLSLGGEYRVRGFYTKNLKNFNSDNKTDELSYFDQRFRVGGKITAAEGVTANFRFDFGEEIWGNRQPSSVDGFAGALLNTLGATLKLQNKVPGAGRPTENAELQVDRLFLRIERDIANFVAGQAFGAFGYVSAFETQSKWLLLRLKPGPVFVDLAYVKLDEGTGTTDDKDLYTEDADLYGANVLYNGENFGVGAWAGYRVDKTRNRVLTISAATITFTDAVNDSNLTGGGIYGTGSFGIVDIKAEFDFFSGENKSTNIFTSPNVQNPKTDLKGQQFWGYANVKLGDAMAIPIHLLYAKGYADKAGEQQVVEMAPAFGDFYPYNLSTIWNGDYSPWPSGEAFDVSGQGGGIMGLYAGFDWQLVEEHKIEFQVGYAAPDTKIDFGPGPGQGTGAATLDRFIFGAAGWQWNFVPAADFSAVVQYGQPSYNDPNQKDDAGYGLLTKIRVKF